jgi:hypothetical protein
VKGLRYGPNRDVYLILGQRESIMKVSYQY